MAGRKCEACRVEYKLWDEIIRQTAFEGGTQVVEPSSLYGDLALRGLDLRTRVVDFGCPVSTLSEFDFYLVEIVHQEVKRRESFLLWKQNQEAK